MRNLTMPLIATLACLTACAPDGPDPKFDPAKQALTAQLLEDHKNELGERPHAIECGDEDYEEGYLYHLLTDRARNTVRKQVGEELRSFCNSTESTHVDGVEVMCALAIRNDDGVFGCI